MSRTGRLPDFVIIGAMKAGTTSLYRLLGTHPDVFMPYNKEPDFFVAEKAWPRGLDWYTSLFAQADGVRAIGEASTSYSKRTEFPGVAGRMARLIPDVRIVYMLRDPIERMRSMYVHNVREGRETASIDDALLRQSMYLDASRYGFQLEAFLEHFPREQIHVLRTEDFSAAPDREMRRLSAFLDLDALSSVEAVQQYNAAGSRRRETLISRSLRSMPAYWSLTRALPEGMKGRAYALLTRPSPRPDTRLRGDTVATLRASLQEDVRRLRAHVGPHFDTWGLE